MVCTQTKMPRQARHFWKRCGWKLVFRHVFQVGKNPVPSIHRCHGRLLNGRREPDQVILAWELDARWQVLLIKIDPETSQNLYWTLLQILPKLWVLSHSSEEFLVFLERDACLVGVT
jgi:hypothetical protein